jgi:hypothetical protein
MALTLEVVNKLTCGCFVSRLNTVAIGLVDIPFSALLLPKIDVYGVRRLQTLGKQRRTALK